LAFIGALAHSAACFFLISRRTPHFVSTVRESRRPVVPGSRIG